MTHNKFTPGPWEAENGREKMRVTEEQARIERGQLEEWYQERREEEDRYHKRMMEELKAEL